MYLSQELAAKGYELILDGFNVVLVSDCRFPDAPYTIFSNETKKAILYFSDIEQAIEKFNELEAVETVEEVRTEKKAVKKTTRKAQEERAKDYDWEVVANDGGYQIQHGQNGKVMYVCKTITGIQRKLSQMFHEYAVAGLQYKRTEFLQKYNVI